MTTTATTAAAACVENHAGKYLTFLLSSESYGIAVLKIREIIRHTDITAVAQMPAYVKGVINLRGKIIPVVDLRVKFGMAVANNTERNCIVVVQVKSGSGARISMGIMVDDVEEVANIAASDIEQTPDFGAALDTQFILGMAKIKGRVKTLLDIDRVVTCDAVEEIAAVQKAA